MKVKQVKIAREMWEGLRTHAKHEGVQFKALQQHAVEWFLKRRIPHAGSTAALYLASPDNGEYRSLWLAQEVTDQVTELAVRDEVSENRVIYTSLCLFWQSVQARSAGGVTFDQVLQVRSAAG